MTLFLFDYGRFENLARALDRKLQFRQRSFSINNNNSSEIGLNSESPSKDDEGEDIVSPISTVCQGHRKTSNQDRRMSVPQLSRNRSIIKTREQRITSVVGVPHRHHITIAVNDEPVDIIKTTCTGPCLQSCHTNSTLKSKSSLPTSGLTLHNNPYLNPESKSINQPTNVILMTLIYVISTLTIRSIINLYIILNEITNIQRKLTLSLLYFFAATMTLTMSLNCFSKPFNSITIRIELIISVLIIIFWSGLHFIPNSSWSFLLFTAVLLGLGSSLLWDGHLRFLSKWSISSSCRPKLGTYNDILSHTNIMPTATIIGHSLHIWSSILVFILLETLTPNSNFSSMPLGHETDSNSNDSSFKSNQSNLCGINIRDPGILNNWKIHDKTLYCLLCICIGLNSISLILIVILLDKTKPVRTQSQSIDKDAVRPMIDGNANQSSDFSNSVVVSGNWISRMKCFIFMWIRNNSKTFVKLWKSHSFKCVMPSLYTMGLVEGFIVTDFNQKFVSCYKKPSFIGISMLMLAIGPIAFVNVFPLIVKHRLIEIFSSPISRAIFFSSSLLLALTKVATHWSYLLVFFPWVVTLDTMVCFSIFYISVSNLPNNLVDSTVVIQRVLRMLGISTYTLISGIFGTFSASLITVVAHIFISPTVIVLGSLVRCSKN